MEQETDTDTLHVNRIIGCARCGENHEYVGARKMARPFAPAEAGGLAWTHWAPCPTNGDPILIRVETDAVLHFHADGNSAFMTTTEVRRG